MLLNESRGRDGTGFFNSNFAHFKNVDKPSVWLKDPKLSRWLQDSANRTWAICGHTRGGTRGGSCTKNAHPFRYGPVIGSHNGVIDSAPSQYVVDSEWAIDNLSKAEPGEYQEALKGLSGWYVLTWLDKRNKCIYILNWNGQMHMTHLGGCYYYSSDADHLKQALGVPDKHVLSLSHTKVLRFHIGQKGLVAEKMPDFTGKDREVLTTYHGNNANSYYANRQAQEGWRDTETWRNRTASSASAKKLESNWMEPTGFITKFPDGLWCCELMNKKFRILKGEFQTELNRRYQGDTSGVSRWRIPIEIKAQMETITQVMPLRDLPKTFVSPSGYIRKTALELKKMEDELTKSRGGSQALTPSQLKTEVEKVAEAHNNGTFPTNEDEERACLDQAQALMDKEAAASQRLGFHKRKRLLWLTNTGGLTNEEAHSVMVDEGYFFDSEADESKALIPVS